MSLPGVKGDPRTLREFSKRLQQIPRTLAQDVASASAPVLSKEVRSSFDRGRNVYGEARESGVNGNALSLVQSGATRRSLGFTAVGTIMRAVLSTRYAKFLIGKYGILPSPRAIPVAWQRELTAIAAKRFTKGITG